MSVRDELTKENKRKAFEILWTSYPIFQTLTLQQFYETSDYFKVVSYSPGSTIVRAGDPVECLGLVLSGTIAVRTKDSTVGTLGTGDMFGYMGLCNFRGNPQHRFALLSTTNGYLALISSRELQILLHSQPLVVLLLLHIDVDRLIESWAWRARRPWRRCCLRKDLLTSRFLRPPAVRRLRV